MEKKTIVVIALAIITFTGIMNINSTDAAITDPITISNLDYLEYEYVLIGSTMEVNLSFITCEYIQSAVTITKVTYYPVENETKYQVVSNHITPDHTFTPDIKTFIYQDENTGQLYTINIDYSEIIPPESPTEIQLQQLQTDYDNLYYNWSGLINETENYTLLIHDLNETLTLFNDSSMISMQMKTDTLYDDFVHYYEQYNKYYDDYTELNSDHHTLQQQKDALQILYQNLTVQYNTINTSLNTTIQELKVNQTAYNNTKLNLSAYAAFVQKLNNGVSTSSYLSVGEDKGTYYTPYYYNGVITELEEANGLIPLWIITTALIIFAICFVVASVLWKQRPLSSVELEESGYSTLASKYDTTILEKTRNAYHKTMRATKNILGNAKARFSKKGYTEQFDQIRMETDNKIRPIQEDVTNIKKDVEHIGKDMTSFHSKIDILIASNTGKTKGKKKAKPTSA